MSAELIRCSVIFARPLKLMPKVTFSVLVNANRVFQSIQQSFALRRGAAASAETFQNAPLAGHGRARSLDVLHRQSEPPFKLIARQRGHTQTKQT